MQKNTNLIDSIKSNRLDRIFPLFSPFSSSLHISFLWPFTSPQTLFLGFLSSSPLTWRFALPLPLPFHHVTTPSYQLPLTVLLRELLLTMHSRTPAVSVSSLFLPKTPPLYDIALITLSLSSMHFCFPSYFTVILLVLSIRPNLLKILCDR